MHGEIQFVNVNKLRILKWGNSSEFSILSQKCVTWAVGKENKNQKSIMCESRCLRILVELSAWNSKDVLEGNWFQSWQHIIRIQAGHKLICQVRSFICSERISLTTPVFDVFSRESGECILWKDLLLKFKIGSILSSLQLGNGKERNNYVLEYYDIFINKKIDLISRVWECL